MVDLKRQRQHPTGQGMTATMGLSDPLTRMLIDELQARINALSLKTTSTTGYDDSELWTYIRKENGRLTKLLSDISLAVKGTEQRADALERAISALHAYVISNGLGETIPPHSVIRVSAYNPDAQIYTAAKPQGPGADQPELLLFTGYSNLEDGALGLGFRPSDILVKASYDAPDVSFEPTAGMGYVTQAADWSLLGNEDTSTAFFIGMGAVDEEWDTSGGLVWIRDSKSASASFDLDIRIPFYNYQGEDCPLGGCVWTPDRETLYEAQGYDLTLKGYYPEYIGISKFCVATDLVVAHGIGLGWVQGGTPRRVIVDDWANTDVGDDLTPWFDQFEAHRIDCGPMTVTAKADDPYVWAVITGKRTEGVYVFMPSLGRYQRFHTIRFRGGGGGMISNGGVLFYSGY